MALTKFAEKPLDRPLELVEAQEIFDAKDVEAWLCEKFRLKEALQSETATKYKIDNWPEDPQYLVNLSWTMFHLWLPARLHFNVPNDPTSVFRSRAL